MSLYNILFGRNPRSAVLLAMLGLDLPDGKWPTGRFRDIYTDGETITVYTRNGGNNRECWNDDIDTENSKDCGCTGCIQTHLLPLHPNYLSSRDDEFDNTYCYIEFSIPEQYQELAKTLASNDPNPAEKWQGLIKEIENMPKEKLEQDPRFKPIIEILKKIMLAQIGLSD